MNHLRRIVSFLLVLVLCFGLIPGVSAAEADTPGADTQTEAAEAEETTPTVADTQPTEELPPETESESTEPPSTDVPIEEPGLMDAIFTGASVMSIASTQNSIMLFDFAGNGNYTTVLNSQVACAYKPNGSGTTRTAYIKNLGWHFARYGYLFYDRDRQIKAANISVGEDWRTQQCYLLVDKALIHDAEQRGNTLLWIMREDRRESRKATEQFGDFYAQKDCSYIGFFRNEEFVVIRISAGEDPKADADKTNELLADILTQCGYTTEILEQTEQTVAHEVEESLL